MRSRPRTTLALACLLVAGCGGHRDDPDTLRVGFMPNVTHAVALTAKQRGSFERAVAPMKIQWSAFGSGPQVVEAIYAGAIDVAYLGPGPAENGFLRSHGKALTVLAGAASGGAALVVRKEAGIRGPEDLHGKILASPQIGNTQDVALRTFLDRRGLRTEDRGGDVRVLPLANPDIVTLMRRGRLDGAWVPEPWVTRLVGEAGGEVLVDERSLWPDGKFVTTVLVASNDALITKRDAIKKLVAAHVDEIAWIEQHPEEAKKAIGAQLAELQGKALPPSLIDHAMVNVRVSWDPEEPVLRRLAADARALGYLPDGDLSRLVDRTFLDEALAQRQPTRP
jgi:NitT/TauT family transport system substrate-binding protein